MLAVDRNIRRIGRAAEHTAWKYLFGRTSPYMCYVDKKKENVRILLYGIGLTRIMGIHFCQSIVVFVCPFLHDVRCNVYTEYSRIPVQSVLCQPAVRRDTLRVVSVESVES